MCSYLNVAGPIEKFLKNTSNTFTNDFIFDQLNNCILFGEDVNKDFQVTFGQIVRYLVETDQLTLFYLKHFCIMNVDIEGSLDYGNVFHLYWLCLRLFDENYSEWINYIMFFKKNKTKVLFVTYDQILANYEQSFEAYLLKHWQCFTDVVQFKKKEMTVIHKSMFHHFKQCYEERQSILHHKHKSWENFAICHALLNLKMYF